MFSESYKSTFARWYSTNPLPTKNLADNQTFYAFNFSFQVFWSSKLIKVRYLRGKEQTFEETQNPGLWIFLCLGQDTVSGYPNFYQPQPTSSEDKVEMKYHNINRLVEYINLISANCRRSSPSSFAARRKIEATKKSSCSRMQKTHFVFSGNT